MKNVRRRAWNPCLIIALALGVVFLIMGVGLATFVSIVWRLQSRQLNSVVHFEEKVLTKKWAEAAPVFRQAYQKQTNEFQRANYHRSAGRFARRPSDALAS